MIVITLNEEARVAACLASLPAGCELIVLDSGSTDRTVEICQEFGAKVSHRAFTNYGEQKNAALALATRDWVLSIDADETLSAEAAIAAVVVSEGLASGHDAGKAGYRIRRHLVFLERQLRFGKASDRPLRLFRRADARFEAGIHEQVRVSGAVAVLPGFMLHYSYNDLTDYFARFNRYTSRIADNHAEQGRQMPPLPLHLLRPWAEFFSRYVLRLGFLDGYPGYTYALVSSLYTYVKYAKLRERLRLNAGSAS